MVVAHLHARASERWAARPLETRKGEADAGDGGATAPDNGRGGAVYRREVGNLAGQGGGEVAEEVVVGDEEGEAADALHQLAQRREGDGRPVVRRRPPAPTPAAA